MAAREQAPESEAEFNGRDLARAHRCNDLIETGRVTSIAELADHNQTDPAYIGRFLRLTTLAPDITERILNGREASGLSLAKLLKDMPPTWEEPAGVFQHAAVREVSPLFDCNFTPYSVGNCVVTKWAKN